MLLKRTGIAGQGAAYMGKRWGMKKKRIIILTIIGILVLGPCIKLAAGSGELPVVDNTALTGGIVSTEGIWTVELPAKLGTAEQEEPEQGPEGQENMVVPEKVLLEKPVSVLNGEEGELRFDWADNVIRIDDDTILFVSDSCFSAEGLQQRIVYLAKAPDFVPQEVFRQDSRVYEEESEWTIEFLERRMPCPKLVEGGCVFEADGLLYFLDDEFQEAVLLCDLGELMGESYLFSPWLADKNKCDVTADASKLLACTDEGLYEYDLKNSEQKLLEPAVFTPHEIVHVEGDCTCGETGFAFDGPVEAEYVPGGQDYVFVAGTEYGSPTGVILRSAEGETLYQREIRDYVGGFRWIEAEDAVYLAVFYREDGHAWMERVDVHTGEKETFAVPDDVFFGGDLYVGFLDADHLICYSEQASESWDIWENDDTGKSDYKIYQLSDEEFKEPEEAGDINGKLVVLDLGGYRKTIIRYSDLYSRIYERFLNGEITAEREGQQVYIDELFWKNDIRYCFLDIEGDGSGELQIRDDFAYYVVKVQGGALRIIWEDWEGYEPVITDERCGFLFYWHEDIYELTVFRKISADGRTAEEDSYDWIDRNQNGIIDEGDSLDWSGWVDRNQNGIEDEGDSYYNYEDIDIEQYLQGREKYMAMLAETEPEWTDRRLKTFTSWQEAYIDFIQKIHVIEDEPVDEIRYSLIYVDTDDVPELYVDIDMTWSPLRGENIISFYDGKIGCLHHVGGLEYVERGGRLYGMGGAVEYRHIVYMLEKGEFSEIGMGSHRACVDEQGAVCYEYFWEGSPVTVDEINACVDALIDRSKCVEPSLLNSEAEILEILME